MFQLKNLKVRFSVLTLLAAIAAGCGGEEGGPSGPNDPNDPGQTPTDPNQPEEPPPLPEPPPPSEWEVRLANRRIDYPRALRNASIRLVGEFPTLDETLSVSTADMAANKTAYEAAVDRYLADPRFATQAVNFWRDAVRLGGNAGTDTVAVFAAKLSVEDGNLLDLFTAATGGCPTFAGGTFTAADCPATTVPGGHAGVLTNQQMIKAFYGPMNFRVGKWVQETFACARAPAEVTAPKDLGGGKITTSPWAMASITGGATAKIDFQGTSVVCLDCHGTKNHQDPLWMNFDDQGVYTDTAQVIVPVPGNPKATLADYLPAGEQFYWRNGGTPVATLHDMGVQIAADPTVAECFVARAWNSAMGQFDIVDGLAAVPSAIIDSHVTAFKTSNYKFREALRSIYKSDDAVKF